MMRRSTLSPFDTIILLGEDGVYKYMRRDFVLPDPGTYVARPSVDFVAPDELSAVN